MHSKNTEFILCWPIFHEYRACPGMWLIYPVSLHGRKYCFLFEESVTNNFLVRGVTLWPLPFSVLGICFAWTYPSLMYAATISMSSHVHHMLYLEDIISLESSITSGSYNLSTFPDPRWDDKDISFRSECSKVLPFPHCLAVGLYISWHLLQKEASIMRT